MIALARTQASAYQLIPLAMKRATVVHRHQVYRGHVPIEVARRAIGSRVIRK
jgi:hypothetical protein